MIIDKALTSETILVIQVVTLVISILLVECHSLRSIHNFRKVILTHAMVINLFFIILLLRSLIIIHLYALKGIIIDILLRLIHSTV